MMTLRNITSAVALTLAVAIGATGCASPKEQQPEPTATAIVDPNSIDGSTPEGQEEDVPSVSDVPALVEGVLDGNVPERAVFDAHLTALQEVALKDAADNGVDLLKLDPHWDFYVEDWDAPFLDLAKEDLRDLENIANAWAKYHNSVNRAKGILPGLQILTGYTTADVLANLEEYIEFVKNDPKRGLHAPEMQPGYMRVGRFVGHEVIDPRNIPVPGFDSDDHFIVALERQIVESQFIDEDTEIAQTISERTEYFYLQVKRDDTAEMREDKWKVDADITSQFHEALRKDGHPTGNLLQAVGDL